MSDDARITELEVKLAYQQQTIDSLNEVVREFAARVLKLELQLKQLAESTRDAGSIGPALDKPPHY